MKTFDGHCDVLYKMWDRKARTQFYSSPEQLHSSFQRLKEGNMKVQTMAIFVPPEAPNEVKHFAALEMIDILYEEILYKRDDVHLLTNAEQLNRMDQDDDLYILLSMEGADPLRGDLTYLRTYERLGVRSLGLTWNYRNEAADGVKERNAAGLSNFGFDVLREMNRLKMAVDISHLAEHGFWDCIEHSEQPVMASHCNARKQREHPRNLYDEQIEAIFKTGGLIGINFVPYFLSDAPTVEIKDVLQHIDYMLSLGGEDHIGLGSDFDGISDTVKGLEHSGKMADFYQECQKHYAESVVEKLFYHNWRNYYMKLWNE